MLKTTVYSNQSVTFGERANITKVFSSYESGRHKYKVYKLRSTASIGFNAD